jgi:hypothetical protein
MGERWYAQDYLCEFSNLTGSVFSHDDVTAAMSPDVLPLFAEVV